MKLSVECYSGRKADERPVRFWLDGKQYQVEAVLDQWYDPQGIFYKVRANDGNIYIIRQQTSTPDGTLVQLTPHEFALLRALAREPGKLMRHSALLREVWGRAYGDESHYLHVYVSQLRRKLEPDPARPRYLLTEPGAGYRLVDPGLRESLGVRAEP